MTCHLGLQRVNHVKFHLIICSHLINNLLIVDFAIKIVSTLKLREMSSKLEKTALYSIVEGEWKQFKFERIQPIHYVKVFDHIKNQFIKEEPTCILLGWSEAFGDELCQLAKIMLDQGLSFMAIDKKTNEIAGIRVTFSSVATKLLDQIELKQLQTQVFWNGIDISEEQKNEILSQFGAVEYIEFFIASVSPQYQNLGLATEMYQRSIKFLTAQGFKVVKCIFTSPTSRHVAKKLGFKEFCRIYFKDLKDLKGKDVFADRKDLLTNEHYACAMVKGLQDIQ